MRIIGYSLLFFSSCLLNAQELSYSLASFAAQQGQWQEAKQIIQKILMQNPERADLLYDAGVIEAQLENFKQAEDYFEMASNKSDDVLLKERAQFNAGNMAVEQKEYQKALDWYEKILENNPDHKQAQHNIQKVKELMEKEKKEKQDQKKDNPNNSKNNEKQQEQQKNNEKSKSESSKESGTQSHDSKDQSSTEGTKQQDQDQERTSMNQQQQERKPENGSGNQDKQDQREQNKHHNQKEQHITNSPDKKDNQQSNLAQDKKEKQKKQEKKNNDQSAFQEVPSSKEEQEIMKLLEAFQEHDDQTQKTFGRSVIQKKLGGTRYDEGW